MKRYIDCAALSEHMGVVKARVDESVNSVTTVDLELAFRFALKTPNLEKIIGKPLTFFCRRCHRRFTGEGVRWDGIVCEMTDICQGNEDNGVYYYTMVVRPPVWMLNYSVNSRSFPEASHAEVIEAVLKEHKLSADVRYKTGYFKAEVYPKLNQIVQPGTSDLTFLQDLMVYAGINYYFACDQAGEKAEMLHLVDNVAFFPMLSNEIPLVSSGGMMQDRLRIESITRLVRVVPNSVKATGFLADGSTDPNVKSAPVGEYGTDGVVELFSPEGFNDPEVPAKQYSTVASEGFAANRIVYQGACDHLFVRPGKRLNLKDFHTATYQILVVGAHHVFDQSVLAALSETGSGDPSYKNHFTAREPLAPIRPTDTWTDVDEQLILDSAIDLDLNAGPNLSPKYKFVPKIKFNSKNKPEENTEAIKALTGAVSMLQAQVRTLTEEAANLKQTLPAGGGGLIFAEVTDDAWVTDQQELVCNVKAEEFEKPIVVKVSVMWYTAACGSQYLPITSGYSASRGDGTTTGSWLGSDPRRRSSRRMIRPRIRR